MDWKEMLAKIRLADLEASLETDQFGVVNVKVENNTYNFRFDNPEAVKAFMEAPKTPELEEAIRRKSERQLEPASSSLHLLSEPARKEIVAASTATASLDVVKKKP